MGGPQEDAGIWLHRSLFTSLFLGSFGRTQCQHLPAALVQEVPHPTHHLAELQGELNFGNVVFCCIAFPNILFQPRLRQRVPTTVFSCSFSLPVTSYLQSMGSLTSVEKMALCKHLTNKDTEVQSSEETFPWPCPVSRRPSGISDLWSSLILLRLHLMANLHISWGSG